MSQLNGDVSLSGSTAYWSCTIIVVAIAVVFLEAHRRALHTESVVLPRDGGGSSCADNAVPEETLIQSSSPPTSAVLIAHGVLDYVHLLATTAAGRLTTQEARRRLWISGHAWRVREELWNIGRDAAKAKVELDDLCEIWCNGHEKTLRKLESQLSLLEPDTSKLRLWCHGYCSPDGILDVLSSILGSYLGRQEPPPLRLISDGLARKWMSDSVRLLLLPWDDADDYFHNPTFG